MLKIDRDQSRFKQIVRGKIRENLKKYVTQSEMIGRKGKDLVSIPVPKLDIPHFKFGDNGSSGAAQGEGEPGTPIGKGQGDQPGQGQAGDQPGGHILEVDVSLEELAEMLGEELELPNIEPKGDSNLVEEKTRYTGIRKTGPESLKHFKRTFKAALKRQVAANIYDPVKPRIIPMRDDKRYRSWKTIQCPDANAVIIYMMDVSGSMGNEQKAIVRTEAFWIDTWLSSQYEGLEKRYIIHDSLAKEVDEETFYHTRESGGTRISSAYHTASKIIEADYPASEWNIYLFHFSDGDNWGEDSQTAFKLLKENLLPVANLFCYGQVDSQYGSGEFLRSLANQFGDSVDNLTLSEIKDREGIYSSIKKFLGKGK